MTLKEFISHVDDNFWINVLVPVGKNYNLSYTTTCCGEAKHVKNSERLQNEIVNDWKISNESNRVEIKIFL